MAECQHPVGLEGCDDRPGGVYQEPFGFGGGPCGVLDRDADVAPVRVDGVGRQCHCRAGGYGQGGDVLVGPMFGVGDLQVGYDLGGFRWDGGRFRGI